MRTLQGRYLRQRRLRRIRHNTHIQRVTACTMVRHDALVADIRPHTRNYSADERRALALAVVRAREAAGHQFRPSFAQATGLSVRSILKIEQGDPVGPSVYEAVARALPGWTGDTPRLILEGNPPPPIDAPETPPEHPAKPRPADYQSEDEYILAVVSHLIRDRNMTADEVVVAVRMATAALRDRSNPDGKGVV